MEAQKARIICFLLSFFLTHSNFTVSLSFVIQQFISLSKTFLHSRGVKSAKILAHHSKVFLQQRARCGHISCCFFFTFFVGNKCYSFSKKKGNFNISRALSYTNTTLNSKSRGLDEIYLRTHAPIKSTFVTLKRLTKQHWNKR